MSIEQMPKISNKAEMISNGQARRVLLNLQGLGATPECSSARMVQKVVQRLGYVQIDSINVLERAHHLILGARLAQYRHEHFTHTLEKSRGLFEHWTHDASAIPTQWFAHWKHRFARYNQRVERSAWWREQFRGDAAPIIRRTLARVRRDGPMRTRDFEAPDGHKSGGWWQWHPEKAALEHLWRSGRLAIARRERFEKVYDLVERVLPSAMEHSKSSEGEHVEWACREAINRLGIASAREIANFFSAVTPAQASAWCERALAQGELVEAIVAPSMKRGVGASVAPLKSFALPDWREFAQKPSDKRIILLCPFDPVVRDRARLLRLFQFDYRFEAFTPAAKRKHGYYVLPLLQGDEMVGRTDLKFDRQRGVLVVRGLWWSDSIGNKVMRKRKFIEALDALARQIGATTCELPYE